MALRDLNISVSKGESGQDVLVVKFCQLDCSLVVPHLPLTPSRHMRLVNAIPFLPSNNPSRIASHLGEPLKAVNNPKVNEANSLIASGEDCVDGETSKSASVDMCDVDPNKSNLDDILVGSGLRRCFLGVGAALDLAAVTSLSLSLSLLSSISILSSSESSSTTPSTHFPHPSLTSPNKTPMTFTHVLAPLRPYLANIPPVIPNVMMFARKYVLPSSVDNCC